MPAERKATSESDKKSKIICIRIMYGMDDDTIHEPKKKGSRKNTLPNASSCPNVQMWSEMNRQEIIVSKCFSNNKILHLFTFPGWDTIREREKSIFVFRGRKFTYGTISCNLLLIRLWSLSFCVVLEFRIWVTWGTFAWGKTAAEEGRVYVWHDI